MLIVEELATNSHAQAVILQVPKVNFMAKQAFQYDIKTPAPNTDADAMVKEIRENVPEAYQMMEKVDVKELFFGIKAATVQFMAEEGMGVQDTLENWLNDMKEAGTTGEWELTFTSRL